MILPKEKKKPETIEPKRLFIFSHPKIGKTSNLSALPNSLIIDLEDGTENYECAAINIKKLSIEQGKKPLTLLGEVASSIKEEVTKGFMYDFVIIDTTTILENIARDFAVDLYKKSVVGRAYTGNDVVSELPSGAGYEWLRIAFKKIYDQFTGTAKKCVILAGHVKNSSIMKDGKDLQARDIQLTGKLKTIVCQDADAIGFMYRNKETNENILSFKTSETDLATGARPDYLSGKEFIISKKEDGKLVTYWDNIFPSIK